MSSILVVLLSVAVLGLLNAGISGQEVFEYPWPGPVEVPIGFFAVLPPNSVRIVFSNNGTDRTLRIGEGVRATLNCSLVVLSLQDQAVTPQSITTSWTLRKFDRRNILSGDPLPVPSDDVEYTISGDSMEILDVLSPMLPALAGEGESGEYTCEACGMMLQIGVIVPPMICRNSTTTLRIIADPPIIARGPETRFVESYRGYNISNDICIRTPASDGAVGIDILCVQDDQFMIPRDPPPDATWSLNGMPLPPFPADMELADDVRQGLGSGGQLSINAYPPPSNALGVYMCNLTSIHGQDSARSILAVSDISASAAISGRADDGCSRFSITSTTNTLCVAPNETVTITCSASLGYTIRGPNGVLTEDTTATVANIASSDAGEYVCDSGPPCNDTVTFTLNVVNTGAPDIVDGPETMVDGDTTFYNVGNDICILSNMPMKIALLCGHNNNDMIRPIPAATWTISGARVTLSDPAITFSDSPLRLGTNDQLLIDNDGDPIRFSDDLRGAYTCTLTNSQGSDTKTTNIDIIPVINTGNGMFILDPPEGRVFIGNATCQTRGGDPTREMVQIRCLPSEAISATTIWFFNGMQLSNTGDTLNIQGTGPGIYTCVLSNSCGRFNASTSILGPPTAPSASNPPVDGPGVVFDIGQGVCIDQSITGNVQIRCPLPMNTDPEFSSVRWSKAGDPSFFFSGTVLSLNRSDSNSVGDYTCTILSGPRGECGVINVTSSVRIQSTITRSSGFVSGTPSGNVLTVGANTCLPPAGQSLRIRCQTTPIVPVMWTLNSNLVTGNEFVDVTSAGTYTCSATDNCGRSVNASSEIIARNSVSITASIDGLSNNGCSRFSNAPPSATVCPSMGETVRIQCTSSTGNYVIIRGSTMSPANQPVVLMPFEDSQAGTYKCTGDGNMCGTPEDELTVFAGGVPPSIPRPRPDAPPPVGMNVSVGEDVCLPFGQSISIDCVATSGTEPITYSWTRHPSSTVISTASKLTVGQIGTYNCTATNAFGSDTASTTVFESLSLSFRVSASSVSSRCTELDTQPPASLGIDSCFFTGDQVTLSCLSQVSMTAGTIQPGNDVGTKTIRELTETDGEVQMFTCSASNICGNASDVLRLFVQDPARINRNIGLPPPSSDNEIIVGAGRPDRPVEVMENMTVRLYCPFTGFDTPSTRWFRVNAAGDRSPVVAMPPNILLVNEVIDNINTSVLIINSFQEELEGTYACSTDNNAGSDEGTVVLRFEAPEPAEWSTTPWSQCDPDCHRGTRMRVVTCRAVNSRLLLPDNRCTEEKPASSERCTDRGPCLLDPVWVPQEWSACSRDCGGGYRVRNLICQIPRTQEIVSNSRCQGLLKPSTFEYCNQHACCSGDLYPKFCKLICGTPLCDKPQYKSACCWSCR